jgi:hypothetical protein
MNVPFHFSCNLHGRCTELQYDGYMKVCRIDMNNLTPFNVQIYTSPTLQVVRGGGAACNADITLRQKDQNFY